MTEKEYTQEQVIHINRIKACRDYYEILEVSKDANEDDLKKKYRKLALQLHPDKNKAPGAVEAFKAVGNAFAVLNDKEKRRQYDLYGAESQTVTRRQQYYNSDDGNYDYSRGFEANVSAEELFNMFFGGGFPANSVYLRRNRYRQNRAHHTQQEEPSPHSVIMQLMPLLILLGVSILSSFLVPDQPFSLSRQGKYMYERKTYRLDIPYYVKENFVQDYQGSIGKIDNQVEEDYLINLRQNCYRERNYREAKLWQAQNYRDEEMERKIKEMKMPACSKLSQLSENIRGY